MRCSAAILLLAPLASAACSRNSLKETVESLLSTTGPRSASSFSLQPNVKISQNAKTVSGIEKTSLAKISGLVSHFRIEAIDVAACQVAALAVVKETNSVGDEPAVLSLRIRAPDGKQADQIEILNAKKGSHFMWAPTAYPDTAPSIWSKALTTNLTGSEIIKAANSYLDGLQAGDGRNVQAGSRCERIENGIRTTSHCEAGLAMFKWPVTDRRWIADEETGVALGAFFFRMNRRVGGDSKDLFLHEYFKVVEGKIQQIQAALQYVPTGTADLWAAN